MHRINYQTKHIKNYENFKKTINRNCTWDNILYKLKSTNTRNNRSSTNGSSATNSKTEALINIIPEDIAKDLEIKIDIELNSFIVSGPSQSVERFKDFIH